MNYYPNQTANQQFIDLFFRYMPKDPHNEQDSNHPDYRIHVFHVGKRVVFISALEDFSTNHIIIRKVWTL